MDLKSGGVESIWVSHVCARCGERCFTQWAASHTPEELKEIQEEEIHCLPCVPKLLTERNLGLVSVV